MTAINHLDFDASANYDTLSEFDICKDCGCVDFYLDDKAWERACTNCGLVSCRNWSEVETFHRPSTYLKQNYFINTVVAKARLNGAPIDNFFVGSVEAIFNQCLANFYSSFSVHKRKNFPHYGFILVKICDMLGKDVKPFVKVPKLKKTLARLEDEWKQYIQPSPFEINLKSH